LCGRRVRGASQAPELFNNKKKASEKADCYSFGCLLWELLAGKVPWAGLSVWQIIMIVESDSYQGLPQDDSWPKQLRDLITQCVLPIHCSNELRIWGLGGQCSTLSQKPEGELNVGAWALADA
jgi:serine/threonine protein kinase